MRRYNRVALEKSQTPPGLPWTIRFAYRDDGNNAALVLLLAIICASPLLLRAPRLHKQRAGYSVSPNGRGYDCLIPCRHPATPQVCRCAHDFTLLNVQLVFVYKTDRLDPMLLQSF